MLGYTADTDFVSDYFSAYCYCLLDADFNGGQWEEK